MGRLCKAALVQLDSNVNDSAFVIHQLGYAIGYDHYDDTSDVMNHVTFY